MGRWVLADRHLTVDHDSYERLLMHFDIAFGLAVDLIEQRAVGDFSPDKNAVRFPAFDPPPRTAASPATAQEHGEVLTLTALLNHKEKTQSQKARTYDG